MVTFPFSSFFESSGNASAEFGEKLRDGVVTGACRLWSAIPDVLTQSTAPPNSFARGFMNQVCSPIQSPVPAPSSSFFGGQCPGILYLIQGTFENANLRYGGDRQIMNFENSYLGPIGGINYGTFINIVYSPSQQNGPIREVTQNAVVRSTDVLITSPNESSFYGYIDSAVITNVTRVDGLPDDCGNLPSRYPPSNPPPDINKYTFTIDNLDGLDLEINVEFFPTSCEYNFPIGMKINGANAILDLEGLTILPPPQWKSNNGDNFLPPPGSDGLVNCGVPETTDIYDDNEYPVGPKPSGPEEVAEEIAKIVCTDGVIETVSETIKVGTGNEPLLGLIIDMLGAIIEEICGFNDISVGLPEYYGLRPGVERPAIVYLYKTFENNKWGKSTYTSTVFFPTNDALDEIPMLTNLIKQTGRYRAQISTRDGGSFKATGISPSVAVANLDWLIARADPSIFPSSINEATIVSEDNRLQEKQLRLRQVEYYPNGKADNRPPDIRRVIYPDRP